MQSPQVSGHCRAPHSSLVTCWNDSCWSPLLSPGSVSTAVAHLARRGQQHGSAVQQQQRLLYPQLLLHKPAATQHSRHFLGNMGGMMEPHHPHPIYGSHHSNGRQLRQQQQNQPQGQASQGQALMPVSSPQMQDSIELSLTHHHHLGQSSIMQPPRRAWTPVSTAPPTSTWASLPFGLGQSWPPSSPLPLPSNSCPRPQPPRTAWSLPPVWDTSLRATPAANNNNNPPQGSVGVGGMLTGGPPPRGVGGAGGRPDSEESAMMAVSGSGIGSGQSAANSW